MAKRKSKKAVDVAKFGGVDSLGSVQEQGNTDTFKSELSGREYYHENTNWEANTVEARSDTKLEQDEGYGNAAIIRQFEFGINPEAFKERPPTRQDLFNAHYKGIEVALWKDGLKVLPDVNPRVIVDPTKGKYSIFVGATPMKGHILKEKPQTLSEIARN